MPRQKLYRERIQLSLHTLVAAVATIPLIVYIFRWLALWSFEELASLVIGIVVSISASRLLKAEETRTLYLMILVACLVASYAFWIPAGVPFYLLGASLGLTCAWQAPTIMTALCMLYGVTLVRVYPMPRWRPSIRTSAWPESFSDSSIVSS